MAVRFIKGGKTLAIHKKTCLLHVYDKRTGLRLLSVSYCLKAKKRIMIKKRLQDIVLLTAISGCIIDIANGSSSYKSRFSHAKALFLLAALSPQAFLSEL